MRILLAITLLFTPFIGGAQIDSTLLLNDLRTLCSDEFEGRGVGQVGHRKAEQLIIERFRELKLRNFEEGYRHLFHYADRKRSRKIEGRNIVGWIKGSKRPTQYIVIGAHYDHLGVVDGDIYNGADDNASGVATLLSVAQYFSEHQPEHSIIIAAWDAEEAGLFGSFAFVDRLPIPKKQVKFYWNMDMMSRSAKQELYVVGTHYRPELKTALMHLYDASTLTVQFGHDDPKDKTKENWTQSSDQGAFHEAGIPWLYYSVEDHPDYHQPTDVFENIDPSFYYRAADLILQSLLHLDQHLETILK